MIKHGFALIVSFALLAGSLPSVAAEPLFRRPAIAERNSAYGLLHYLGEVDVDINPAAFESEPGSVVGFDADELPGLLAVHERKIYHRSGSVTWVGHLKDHSRLFRVLITRHPGGSFGSILTPKGGYQIETRDGRVKLIDVNAQGRFRAIPSAPDAIQAPAVLASAVSPVESATTALALPSLAVALRTEVDLLVLYTPGMVAKYGSGLQAYLDSLVAYANQAYVDSGVNMVLRIVNAVPVSYSDTVDNAVALGDLHSGTAPAFSNVAAMRNTYGADLITLVRPFNVATHGGCGIGFIPSPMNSAAGNSQFAFSVVSTGNDTGGSLYYCHSSSLTHELGHNMGSQHDRANTGGVPGYFAYSYGYGQQGVFGTIMSYLDPTVGRFSNPLIMCTVNLACGVPESEDNTRSLNNLASMIGNYRPKTVFDPVVTSDFDGDGRSDILWRHAVNGKNTLWPSGTTPGQALAAEGDQNWKIVGVGDFDGNGRADILWRHATTGQNRIWFAGTTVQALPSVVDLNWQVAGAGDFDGDGRSDILWRHAVSGKNTLWPSGTTPGQALAAEGDQNWKIVGVSDFDGNGRADILWRHATTGQNRIWFAGTTVQALPSVVDLNWQVAGAGDFDGDGRSDILWRHAVNGKNTLWPSGTTPGQALAAEGDQNWKIVGVGDFDGNGRADILWRHATTGQNRIWFAGTTPGTPIPNVTDLSWKVRP